MEPQYFTEGMSAYEALRMFKASQIHYALVIDEFGEMEGMVTLNDLLEALVGDVSEFYADDYSFVERRDGTWLVDGQYPLPEFLHRFDLDELIPDYPFNTLSGLILHEYKRVPDVGDVRGVAGEEVVHDRHSMTVGEQEIREMGADEACSAGDQDMQRTFLRPPRGRLTTVRSGLAPPPAG